MFIKAEMLTWEENADNSARAAAQGIEPTYRPFVAARTASGQLLYVRPEDVVLEDGETLRTTHI